MPLKLSPDNQLIIINLTSAKALVCSGMEQSCSGAEHYCSFKLSTGFCEVVLNVR